MASKADIERAIAEARGVWNNPFNLGTRGFWAFFDAMFDRFVSAGPERVDELRRLADATGGPVLDGTPGSLGLLDDWLRVAVVAGADWDDGADWLPVWTRVTEPWPLPRGMRWPEFLRLEERVAFYFADVLMSQLPGAKWVCWRDERFNTNRTGD
ncbi:MAG: hypothetical protein LBC97_11140, partial [Bifidobacteriaceae bacterium]|nr:hypothetical protein [Bifidobacteriaceae bacterium]